MEHKLSPLTFLDKLFVGILLAIFVGIVVHAPLSVGFGSLFPELDLLIKSWKEVLMGLAAPLGVVAFVRRKQLGAFLKQPLVLLVLAYVAIHIALLPFMFENWTSAAAGLLIDLRYILYFLLVLAAMWLYPSLRHIFLYIFLLGALVVGLFAIAQVFILPPDVLTLIGYNEMTIQPFLAVDENPDYIRINGTMRGPNPLGAYAVIVLALLAAYFFRTKKKVPTKANVIAAITAIGSAVALWWSFSRSALVAAFAAIGLVLLLTVGRHLKRWMWITLIVVIGASGGLLFAARDTDFVQNVIFHENDGTGAATSSNEGHLESLIDGTERMVNQPLGAGIGSTGSASLYTDQPVIIENQYLFIAHEVGWLGLLLFVALFSNIMLIVWRRRNDWLALGVLASGVGLAMIGILLPVWVDDTVSIIWWGLAAVAIGGMYGRQVHKKTKSAA